jgi:hypothetical protein
VTLVINELTLAASEATEPNWLPVLAIKVGVIGGGKIVALF